MSVATPTMTSNGTSMPQTYEVLSIDIRQEVNRIPSAEVRIIDGDTAKQSFEATDGEFFAPGAIVEIKMRYEGQEDRLLFSGIVVKHSVEINANGSTLVVSMKHAAVKLTGARTSNVFAKKSDSEIIKQLLTTAGVRAGVIDGPHGNLAPIHDCMVQYDSTPWDFIVLRAEALGLLVVVDDQGAVTLKSMIPPGSDKPKHTWNIGVDEIYDIDLERDAMNPYTSVESVAWDALSMKSTAPVPRGAVASLQNDNVAKQVEDKLGRQTCRLSHTVPATQDELQTWANARWVRSRLSMVRGRIAIPGTADIKLLDTIGIDGIGKRFAGFTYATGLCQRYDASGWRTDVQFGLSSDRHCLREDIADVAAHGLLPPSRGLQIGVVQAFEEDPQKQLRVKVLVPGVDNKPTSTLWARLTSPDAGVNRGFFFRPEMGDEVVIGFLHDDPRHPVILGSLFGATNKAPAALKPPSNLNDSKGLVTKKTRIIFGDGDKPSITIETMSKNKIIIDDAAGGISLMDQNGNKIILDANGITLDAGGKTVTIKGAKVDVA